jgi:ribonuclease HI
MKNCEKFETLGDRQDGFRKGRSTTRTLLQNEILNDYNKRLRINNFVGMTDISGCFDRILPPIISLLNRRNGCPSEAVTMHAKTLESAKYYLKTKQGISTNFYSHTEETPVYGNGQGAGDSPSQWSQESALLLDLYEQNAPTAEMTFRDGTHATKIPVAAFADDTNLFGNDDKHRKTKETIVSEAKTAFETWNKLLHATGHFMELGKCACYLSIWDFQEDGYAFTIPPAELQVQIEVNDINGRRQIIEQLSSETSQKLLGVMKNPIGNQQDEVKRLKKKSDEIAVKINSVALSKTEAKMAYEAFYLPAMRYSLSTTSINQIDFESIQSKATLALLAVMGYNRHMPREVVFAPKTFQGLGLKHLYDLQGCDAVRLLLQETSERSSNMKTMINALIDVIQLESGLGSPILEDTRPLDYLEWGWIPQIREFLHHIQGQIIGVNQKPEIFREGDQFIMEAPTLRTKTHKERMLIHRCRLYLQVELLSDITNASGTRILNQWKNDLADKPSTSLKHWPRQRNPGKEAWKIWRNFLRDAFENSNGTLRQPLARWLKQNTGRRHAAYYDDNSKSLFIYDDQLWRKFIKTANTRRQLLFKKDTSTLELNLPSTATPLDIISETEAHWVTSLSTPHNMTEIQRQQPKHFQEKIAILQNQQKAVINVLLDNYDISEIFEHSARIEVATDGGFNPQTGKSSYGWIVAANKTLIAKGRGPAAAHPELAESFRAEGFGIFAALRFLQELTSHFQIDKEKHTWRFYLDNRAMIQRMESYEQNTRHSKWHLRPDADITNQASEILAIFPASLIHVKSHQDINTDFDKLSYPAQLNVMADLQATTHHDEMTKPMITYEHPYPTLVLGNIPITRDSQKWILRQAGKVPIQHYYKEKYGWTKEIFNDIDWDIQEKALRYFSESDQSRILKFVHGWLPTNKRLYREGIEKSPKCQLCNALEESNDHLWICSRDIQENARVKIMEYIWRDNSNHGNSELNNIIELAFSESTHNSKWTPLVKETSGNIRRCIIQQNKIGWDQLLKGRMTKEMRRTMDHHYRQLKVDTRKYTGERWCKRLLQNIWQVLLQLWKQRNELIHDSMLSNQESKETERIKTRVFRCYEHRESMTVADRERIFYTEAEQLLQEDKRLIKAWLRIAERIIKTVKKENERPNNSRKLLETYLQWKPRTRKKPCTAAELQPD